MSITKKTELLSARGRGRGNRVDGADVKRKASGPSKPNRSDADCDHLVEGTVGILCKDQRNHQDQGPDRGRLCAHSQAGVHVLCQRLQTYNAACFEHNHRRVFIARLGSIQKAFEGLVFTNLYRRLRCLELILLVRPSGTTLLPESDLGFVFSPIALALALCWLANPCTTS